MKAPAYFYLEEVLKVESLIEAFVVERSRLSRWQGELEKEGWSPWSMHQWMYLEGKIAGINEVLQYYYANVKEVK